MIRRYHLDVRVAVYLAVVLAVGLAAMSSQNNLLFWIFGVMVAALCISGIVSGVMMVGLSVHRLDPRHGTVGEPLIARYRLSNRNRFFPVFNIHVEDLAAPPAPWWHRPAGVLRALLRHRLDVPAAIRDYEEAQRRAGGTSFWRLMRPARAWVMHAGPREEVHGEAVFWPARRGEARFDHVRIWTTFPFGLVKKSITFHQPSHTLIYPRRYELRRGVLNAITPAGPLGMLSTQRAGSGDDYYGLREYRAGEPLRHIAWKRTANRDEIVCIEHTQNSPPRLRVALNLAAAVTGPGALELQEQAISLAASIIHAADAEGYETGLTILGFGTAPLPIRRNQWHLSKMMAALAAIDLDAPRCPVEPGGLRDVERVGLVVVHGDRVDPRLGRADAWHLSARQLDQLATGAIGWDPRGQRPAGDPATGAAA